MSYQEQASKMNERLKKFFHSDNEPSEISLEDKEMIDTILWFGQVAKYRCRSNTAYDNFCKVVFDGIVEVERTKKEGMDFEILQVKEVK